jgi:hypothetical protein
MGALSLACANQQPRTADDYRALEEDDALLDERPPPEAPPLTPEQRQEVDQAAKLGRLLFEHDTAAAQASAFLRAQPLPEQRRSEGWVTVRNGSDWEVPFLFTSDDEPTTLQTVRIPAAGAPALDDAIDVEQADERHRHMFTALQTVRARFPTLPKCTNDVNHVVLPAEEVGKSGWLVYLLAAPPEPGVVVTGGHHRFLVSSDGKEILEHFEFARPCKEIPVGADLAAPILSHATSPTPTEVHVFLSYVHRLPVLVTVSQPHAVWGVSGARIEQIPLEE